ncbi:MAG: acyltransferase family protein, partial [Planctomycetota bacterium]
MFGTFRFVLAHMVVLGHLWPALRVPTHMFAVFGFYVLSGYLMSLVLTKSYGFSPRGTARFLGNRGLRIYPPYLAALLLGLGVVLAIPDAVAVLNPRFRLPESALGWLHNGVIFGLLRDGRRLVPSAWSLEVELIFYLAMGLLLVRWRVLVFLWFALSVAYTLFMLAQGYPWVDRYIPPQAASLPFSTGALLFHVRDRLRWIRAWQGPPALLFFALHAFFATAIWGT